MPVTDALQLLLQAGLGFAFCLLLWLVGSIPAAIFDFPGREEKNDYTGIFYRMLSGILVIVLLYAIFKTAFKTIYILMVPAAFFYLRKRNAGSRSSFSFTKIPWGRVAEIFIWCGVFCLLFNFLPESENKQKDSFFYLKIAEALNRTGQENLHHYYNLLDARYHGAEPYHYMELWLNAFLLNFTGKQLPGIQTLRIVTYSSLSVAFLFGLFHFYKVITGAAPGIGGKLVCFSFLFFMPDLHPWLPAIVRRYLVFNFENNFLERPNFRMIYLLLLPVLTGVFERKYDRFFLFFLLCLCLVNPLVFVVMVPVVFLSSIVWRKSGPLPVKDLIIFFSIAALYPVFYFAFSVREVPVPYHVDMQALVLFFKKSYRYIVLTIAGSLCYTGILCLAGWLIFRGLAIKERRNFLRENRNFVLLIAITIACSVVIARVFDFVENFYQVAYTGYILAALFLFSLLVLLSRQGVLQASLVIVLLTGGYIAYKYENRQTTFANIFLQNGSSCYNGKPYSAAYLNGVAGFMQTAGQATGAYIADTGYYHDLYYSMHNPVVYHLPVTYIISNHVLSNIDYCASDTSAIYCGVGEGQGKTYLANGVARSFFHNGFLPGSDKAGFGQRLSRFIEYGHLRYLVITKDVLVDTTLHKRISGGFTDVNTGERFLILKPAGP